jgi:hypothetical protein
MINEDPDREAAGLIHMNLHPSRGLWELERPVCLLISSLSIDIYDLIHSRLSIWQEETYTLSACLHQVNSSNHSSTVLVGQPKCSGTA